ncbi:MAG: insulinase family protein [Flavobacteriales bacterium]|nr:MAG: insulinase family protein [Flavobacteriales bacterium]
MKKYILSVALLCVFSLAFAQSKPISFDVNGLKVILQPTNKETVSMKMYFRGGVMNFSEAQAGIENLALSTAATCGTKKYLPADYHELADEYGIEINGASFRDYGTIGMDCISKYYEEGWKLFSDAIVNPVFDDSKFKLEREKILLAINASGSNPENKLKQMSIYALFAGKQYGLDPLGSIAIVKKLTSDSVKQYYYDVLLNRSKMFLVVAGNITKEQLEEKIKVSFNGIPTKAYTAPVYDFAELKGERLYVEHRPLATNYFSCLLNAPKINSPDYFAFELFVNMLSGTLNYELRTKRGLSYSPGAELVEQQLPYLSMYVSTTQPKLAYNAMVDVYSKLRSGQFSGEYLRILKKGHRDRFYRHQESASTIVDGLGNAEIFGDYRAYENMMEAFNKVTVSDVANTYNNYLKGAIWVYLGDEQVAKETFK